MHEDPLPSASESVPTVLIFDVESSGKANFYQGDLT